ncbi:GPP34 family phosphoprotein [Yimella sp. cx-51]|uniref:GPP34 family phosphoprotein n=1 Tax=Yimella sp. cx-51 TaxID=2770551 RepID=UPI00165DD5EC|nr:GPP34 family phosphoprotein [Yimella sp. cx-51]MBC9958018.1 GPP34 family phosphoprotein [Yimella sp. cx-51]QTH38141.1 GPP34 family phosphoprotein [Yimella sp. cx-51]
MNLSAAAVATLLLTNPSDGRRQDVQRIGPIVRAFGLDELVREGAVEPYGEEVVVNGPVPPPATWFAATLGDRPSWRAAVGKKGRETLDAALEELVAAGAIVHSKGGFLRPSHTSLTPQGRAERDAILQRWQSGPADDGAANQQQLLAEAKMLDRVTDGRIGVAAKSRLAEPVREALKRAVLDRRIAMMGG